MAINDQSKWRFNITALDGSTPPGAGWVLNTAAKQFTYNINSGKSTQFIMNIDNPRANYVLSNDCLLKVYRRNRLGNYDLLMVGDVISTEETGQGDIGVITVTATDPFWRLQHRAIGMGVDARGRGVGWSDGTYAADGVTILKNVDMSQAIADLVQAAFWNAYAYTGIRIGTVQASTSNPIGPIYATMIGDIIQQITTTLGGPDFEIVPVEPSGAWPNTTIGQLNVWPHLGSLTPTCIFDYGVGKHNVASYDRLVTKDGIANLIWSTPNGFPTSSAKGDSVLSATDNNSIMVRGQHEYILSGDNLASPALRQELANETLAVLSPGRQQITFVPIVDCPSDFMVDYRVGDIVTARANVNGQFRFSGTARIYGVTFQINENDQETPALTLIPGG